MEDKCRDLEIQPPPATAGQDRSRLAAQAAIRDRQRAINDDELLDYLIRANNDTTSGFFKIKTEQAGYHLL